MSLDSLDGAALAVLAWVGTYLFHSTLLIGLVWGIGRVFPRLGAHSRDAMWKAALVGAVMTASVQGGAGLAPAWGPTLSPESDEVARPGDEGPRYAPIASSHVFISTTDHAFELRAYRSPGGELPVVVPAAAPAKAAFVPPWAATVILSLLGLGAGFALIRLGVTFRRLRGQLARRRDVLEDPLLETFLGLCQRAGVKRRVRLTAGEGLGSPVALWRREICVPERAIEGLPARQQESMLAHELAHVLRGDPWWLATAAILEAIFFFQPLNRLARRNLQEAAELICDDFAVRMTGTGVHLAKCLAEVATWLDNGNVPLASAIVNTSSSSLVKRIKRLLGDSPRARGSAPRRVAMVVGLLAAVIFAAPAVSVAGESEAADEGVAVWRVEQSVFDPERCAHEGRRTVRNRELRCRTRERHVHEHARNLEVYAREMEGWSREIEARVRFEVDGRIGRSRREWEELAEELAEGLAEVPSGSLRPTPLGRDVPPLPRRDPGAAGPPQPGGLISL